MNSSGRRGHGPRWRGVATLLLAACAAACAVAGDFAPDPATVQRKGPAYRYPQAGWIVVHIEGEPYERGVQHGELLAEEIAAHLRCFAADQSPAAPTEGYKITRTLVNALFLRRFEREYLEEMRGIADGAAAAGATFDGRPIDLIDIVALNMWAELMTLDGALEATPTGLEGLDLPRPPSRTRPAPEGDHCSAFAATGPATADGKIVFGHITMFGLYPGGFYNVWLDIKPARGQRILMQSYPGGIYSGMDYYLNDVGLMVSETTIDQTRFDAGGTPLASRMRAALQYCDNIDCIVEKLTRDNNGLYTNEWLLADAKSNEIAMLELGTHAHKLWRSSKGEWYGGTEGFYWGCNNSKDLAVRLETIAALNDEPGNVIWRPTDRDIAWLRLYERYKGRIDADFGKLAFTTPPLCGFSSLDAKFTTSAMAQRLATHAVWGPPLGRTWRPTHEELDKYHDVPPLVSNSWTVLTGAAPSAAPGESDTVDLPGAEGAASAFKHDGVADKVKRSDPAWRGTLLPATDGDIWLAAAFSDYEKIVGLQRGLEAVCGDPGLCAADRRKLAANLYSARSRYLSAAARTSDVPLSQIKPALTSAAWYDMAAGKGVLVLAELQRRLGDDAFVEFMDRFGRANGGKRVASRAFAEAAEKAAGKPLGKFFDYWLDQPGLPTLAIKDARADRSDGDEGAFIVSAQLAAERGPLPGEIEVTLEYEGDEETQTVTVNQSSGRLRVACDEKPLRLVVDKYARAARANGGAAMICTFADQIDQTLIVYGTLDDAAGNRDAAETVQKKLIEAWFNVAVPIRSDNEVRDEELRGNHLILIGRPATNAVTQRLADGLPAGFGSQSFAIDGRRYAHMGSGLALAARSPLGPARAITLLAGNSAAATVRLADKLDMSHLQCEAVVRERDGTTHELVLPASELTWRFDQGD